MDFGLLQSNNGGIEYPEIVTHLANKICALRWLLIYYLLWSTWASFPGVSKIWKMCPHYRRLTCAVLGTYKCILQSKSQTNSILIVIIVQCIKTHFRILSITGYLNISVISCPSENAQSGIITSALVWAWIILHLCIECSQNRN